MLKQQLSPVDSNLSGFYNPASTPYSNNHSFPIASNDQLNAYQTPIFNSMKPPASINSNPLGARTQYTHQTGFNQQIKGNVNLPSASPMENLVYNSSSQSTNYNCPSPSVSKVYNPTIMQPVKAGNNITSKMYFKYYHLSDSCKVYKVI